MKKNKPFLKWAGGKRQLLTQIEAALPEALYSWDSFTYVEPFVGSGAVLFRLLQKFPNIEKAIINDKNPDLINAYTVVKKHPRRLIKNLRKIHENYAALEDMEDKKKYFLAQRAIFNERRLYKIKQTALLIFLNKTCFNGLYRVNSKGKFNVPFGQYKKPNIVDEATILKDSIALQKVSLFCGDFKRILPKVKCTNALFYLDPPYKPISTTASFNGYTGGTFGDAEQEELKAFCDKIHQQGYHFLLSNSDLKNTNCNNHFFDELYTNYNIQRVRAKRLINSVGSRRGDIHELLIDNF